MCMLSGYRCDDDWEKTFSTLPEVISGHLKEAEFASPQKVKKSA